jgi:hypothetical protein
MKALAFSYRTFDWSYFVQRPATSRRFRAEIYGHGLTWDYAPNIRSLSFKIGGPWLIEIAVGVCGDRHEEAERLWPYDAKSSIYDGHWYIHLGLIGGAVSMSRWGNSPIGLRFWWLSKMVKGFKFWPKAKT